MSWFKNKRTIDREKWKRNARKQKQINK
jgi:hypothetical protein